MAEIASPISGGLTVAKRTVSADSFVRAAPAPTPIAQPDPVTTSLIQRNSLALNTVSGQLASLTQQVSSLSDSMQAVYANITQSSGLERIKDIQEQNRERQLAEQQLREGKESIIERRIQNALVEPVQKVAAKASFTLSRVRDFFFTLLGGWLVNQTIETIKNLSEDNRKKLENIKNNILKNLGIVGGVFASIRFGLTSVFNGLTQFASKVTSVVTQGLFLRPVQALLDGVKGAADRFIPKIKNLFPNFFKPNEDSKNNPPPAETAPGTGTTPPPAETAPGTGTTPPPVAGTPAPGTPGTGTTPPTTGTLPLLPSPPTAGTSASSGKYIIFGGQRYWERSNGDLTFPLDGRTKPTSEELKQKQGSAQSSISMVPETNTFQQSSSTNLDQSDFSQPPMYGEINVEKLLGMSATETAQITGALTDRATPTIEAQIMPIKQEANMKSGSVGPLPEPAPTILPFPLPGSTSKTQAVSSSQSGEAANSVPSINPENMDNYLLLYSHSVYNVPMT
jgi:hypothetical protein